MIIGLVSALFIQVSDSDVNAILARIHAAKTAAENCVFTHAAQMYHGKDDPQLERQIADSCSREFNEMLDAESAGASPQAKAAGRAAFEPMIPDLVHAAVEAQEGH